MLTFIHLLDMGTWNNAARPKDVSLSEFGIGGDAPIFAYLPKPKPLNVIQPTITFYTERNTTHDYILHEMARRN